MTAIQTTNPAGPRYRGPAVNDRRLPWDVMGAKLTPKATTVAGALAETGMDAEVRLVPLQALDPQAGTLDANGIHGIVRPLPDGTTRVLAAVGNRYTPIQNRDAFAPADYLVSEFGAKITAAADFRGGTASLLVVDLADPVHLDRPDGGTDQVDLNLLIKNDHAGNAALTLALTGMRVACTNAVQAAVRNADRVWKISHTPNAAGRLNVAAQAIQKAVTYRQEFVTVAQAMMDTPMVDAEFQKIVAGLFPVKDDDTGVVADRRRETRALVLDMYRTGDALEGIRGTRWGGYNALTEYLDWVRPVRGQEDLSRAEGALEGPYVRTKARLWGTFAQV